MHWTDSCQIIFYYCPWASQAQDFQDPDVHHRHLSHLFGLYPGHSITKDVTPELCAAAAKSLYKRGEPRFFVSL